MIPSQYRSWLSKLIRASRSALGGWLLGLLGGGFGFGGSLLSLGAHNLLEAEGKGAARCGTDERQAEEGDAGHGFLIDGGEEAVEAEGFLASFGDDDLIASEDVDIVRLDEMLAREAPEELWPGDDGSEEALNGAVAGALATPAGDAGHGHTASHGQEGEDDVAQLANGGRRQTWLETVEQC